MRHVPCTHQARLPLTFRKIDAVAGALGEEEEDDGKGKDEAGGGWCAHRESPGLTRHRSVHVRLAGDASCSGRRHMRVLTFPYAHAPYTRHGTAREHGRRAHSARYRVSMRAGEWVAWLDADLFVVDASRSLSTWLEPFDRLGYSTCSNTGPTIPTMRSAQCGTPMHMHHVTNYCVVSTQLSYAM